jgi:hypothetical protein
MMMVNSNLVSLFEQQLAQAKSGVLTDAVVIGYGLYGPTHSILLSNDALVPTVLGEMKIVADQISVRGACFR